MPAERELAQRFGVSRTAVREAMKASLHGRGTFVIDRSRPGASAVRRSRHVDEHRTARQHRASHLGSRHPEPEIAARAAASADALDLVALREAFDAMDRQGRNAEAFIEAYLDFHLALAEAAGNPIILGLIDSFVVLLRKHRLRMFSVNGRGQCHHRHILEAVERHDEDGARRAMQAHLEQVSEDTRRAPEPAVD